MLAIAFVLALFGGSSLADPGLIYRCGPTLIAKAKSFWNGGSNDGILEKVTAGGPYAIKSETLGYLSGADNLECGSIYFVKEDGKDYTTGMLRMVFKDGTSKDLKPAFYESEGAVLIKTSTAKRFTVYSDNGVVAIFVCYDDETSPLGPPATYIMTNQNEYSQEAYQTAVNNLKSLGGDPTFVYPDTCPII